MKRKKNYVDNLSETVQEEDSSFDPVDSRGFTKKASHSSSSSSLQ